MGAGLMKSKEGQLLRRQCEHYYYISLSGEAAFRCSRHTQSWRQLPARLAGGPLRLTTVKALGAEACCTLRLDPAAIQVLTRTCTHRKENYKASTGTVESAAVFDFDDEWLVQIYCLSSSRRERSTLHWKRLQRSRRQMQAIGHLRTRRGQQTHEQSTIDAESTRNGMME